MLRINKYIYSGLVTSLIFILSGCSSVSSDEVIADSVSGYEYDKMTCSQIESEIAYLQKSVSQASGVVDKKKSSQGKKSAAAFLLFWPALFIVDDNSLEAQKYSRLKGEYEGALRVHRKKDC